MEERKDINIMELLYGLWCEETFTKPEIAKLLEIPDEIQLGDILGDLVAGRLIYVFYHPSPTRYRISPKGKQAVRQYMREQKQKPK